MTADLGCDQYEMTGTRILRINRRSTTWHRPGKGDCTDDHDTGGYKEGKCRREMGRHEFATVSSALEPKLNR